jgi:mono/diheme cytochrome c family protein
LTCWRAERQKLLGLALTIIMRLFAITLSSLSALVAGCGTQPYPTSMTYPLRTDPLVARLPNNPPDGPPAAGKLDEFIGQINERGGKIYDPNHLNDADKAKLTQFLTDAFGTPAAPLVTAADEEDRSLVEHLQLQPDRLAQGSKLYKSLCLQCHGLTGDGRGPTGNWVYPLPRDLRQGIFKYVSSAGSAARKPNRADMHRILKTGIERTSMPPFALLSDDERDKIIGYTIHLSLRGEVEYRVLLAKLSDADDADDDITRAAQRRLKTALRQWAEADAEAITPATMPTPESPDAQMSPEHLESVRRGHALFASEANGCISCHTDYGRQARYLYDAWGGSVRVADLTEGVFRGGKTPLEIFCRIRGGIGPSGMPAVTSLSEVQIWDLVHFVQAMPNPKMLPPDVRRQVYPRR